MRVFEFETHKVVEVDESEGRKLIDSKKAVELDIPELDRLEQKAEEVFEAYRTAVEGVKNSDNPLLQDEKVRAYELNKIEKEYRQKSAEIEAKWKEYRARRIEEAKERAARAVVNVTEKDKATAEQFKNRAALKLAAAANKSAALLEIKNEIAYLTDEQKTALQSYIPALLSAVDDEEGLKAEIIREVQNIRNSDLLAVKVAEQLPHSVLTKQRIDDIARKVAQDDAGSALRSSEIDREFYEKHLKRGDN